jgi:hypothetical protein
MVDDATDMIDAGRSVVSLEPTFERLREGLGQRP